MTYAPIISPTAMPPRLRIELVPRTCWMSNVRVHLSQHYGRVLAAEVAADGQYRCEVCGGRGRKHPVEAHEVWLYDHHQQLQTLLRLQALCPMCHSVKHAGRVINQGNEQLVLDWLTKVNGWTEPQAIWYLDAVFAQWRERSKIEWALDLTVLNEVYGIPLKRLALERLLLTAAERRRIQADRRTRAEDPFDRDGRPL